jgi:hypothetical protein
LYEQVDVFNHWRVIRYAGVYPGTKVDVPQKNLSIFYYLTPGDWQYAIGVIGGAYGKAPGEAWGGEIHRWKEGDTASDVQIYHFPWHPCFYSPEELVGSGLLEGFETTEPPANGSSTFRIEAGSKVIDASQPTFTKPYTFFAAIPEIDKTFIRMGGWGPGSYFAIDIEGTDAGVYDAKNAYDPKQSTRRASFMINWIFDSGYLSSQSAGYYLPSSSSPKEAEKARVVITEFTANRIAGEFEGQVGALPLRGWFDIRYPLCAPSAGSPGR